MKKIFVIMSLLLICSCVYKNMYHFENGDLDWITSYNEGDTIRFQTNNGIDLLYIDKKIIYDKSSSFIENEGQEFLGDYHASAHYVGTFIHNQKSHYFSLSIQKKSDSSLDFQIVFVERYCYGISDERNMDNNGISLKDTIIIDNANSEYSISGPKSYNCEYLKWSKRDGLVEYRLRDGTVYPKTESTGICPPDQVW